LNAVDAIASTLPQPVVAQIGSTPCESQRLVKHRFLGGDEFERMIQNAQLVICHAGAGCVIQAVRAGKVPVVMPRRKQFDELIDDHQVEFVRLLVETGKAVAFEEADQLSSAVAKALERQLALKGQNASEPPLAGMLAELLHALSSRATRSA
jgi:UDP-N-acetylglucosamine transferase subunit ALG13